MSGRGRAGAEQPCAVMSDVSYSCSFRCGKSRLRLVLIIVIVIVLVLTCDYDYDEDHDYEKPSFRNRNYAG